MTLRLATVFPLPVPPCWLVAVREDAAKLDDAERNRWRQQALAWLRADLSLWSKYLDSADRKDQARARQALRDWQDHPDFASMRAEKALTELPDAESQAWRQLWAEVDRLRKATQDVK